jgi:hypothetical protein
MLLLVEAAYHEFRSPIQVFGSDLDARALRSHGRVVTGTRWAPT